MCGGCRGEFESKFRGKIIEPRSARPDLGASMTNTVSQPSRNSSSDKGSGGIV